MKRILLVNPHESDQAGFTNPPLGLLYIAGTLLQHKFEVRVVDGCRDGRDAIQAALVAFQPDIVGITCLTPGRKKALEVAEMVKGLKPQTIVVLGGAHATIMFRQILEHYSTVDYVVLGEGEETFLEISQENEPADIHGIAYRLDGEIIKTPPRKYIENLDKLPFPAWHLLDLKKYPGVDTGVVRGVDLACEPRISVVFSRGCKGHCDFCSTWWIWQGWRHRSPQNMVDELELLYRTFGIRNFCFADDAMTVDRQAILELCDDIIARDLNIVFHVTTRSDCVDAVMLQKLKAAGCYKIAFGIETGSPRLLEQMGKENDIATAELAIKLAKEAGILVTALVIVGNIGETEESIRDTIAFLRRTTPDDIGCVGGLWILPGTKLYQQCKRKGYIDDDFWLGDEPYKIYAEEYSLCQLAQLQKRVTKFRPLVKRAIKKLQEILS